MLVFEVEYYETLISLCLLNVASIDAFGDLPTSIEPSYVKCTCANDTIVLLLCAHGQLRSRNSGGGT
jgi:hypothetical protein